MNSAIIMRAYQDCVYAKYFCFLIPLALVSWCYKKRVNCHDWWLSSALNGTGSIGQLCCPVNTVQTLSPNDSTRTRGRCFYSGYFGFIIKHWEWRHITKMKAVKRQKFVSDTAHPVPHSLILLRLRFPASSCPLHRIDCLLGQLI